MDWYAGLVLVGMACWYLLGAWAMHEGPKDKDKRK